MNNKKCFFIGNRYTPSHIKTTLIDTIEKHIEEYYVTKFTVGHYGTFDNMVIETLRNIRQKYNKIEVYLLCPYIFDQKKDIPRGFNGTIYPEGLETVPKPYAIIQANKYMVKNSDYLISYCHNITGNTQKIIKYAKNREKQGLIKITLL